MPGVNTNVEEMLRALQRIRNAMRDAESAKAVLLHKYQRLGDGWHDRKYEELGDIVSECNRALEFVIEVLTTGDEALVQLIVAIQEYENTNLGGGVGVYDSRNKSDGFDGGNGSTGGRTYHMTSGDVSRAYQSGIDDIDSQIGVYKEELMQRGVPDGEWLDSTLDSHRRAMIEQLSYDLDVASGHANDTMHSADAYCYPSDYSQFYDQLAMDYQRSLQD